MQRSIEVLIGRLATDEEFRLAFQRNPQGTLREASDWGLALTDAEIRALVATDQSLWDRIADELDGRLQKASLNPTRHSGGASNSDSDPATRPESASFEPFSRRWRGPLK